MNLNELTIAQAAAGIRKKEFSIAELVSDCLDAIREKNQNLHAYLDVFEDAAEQAHRADAQISTYRHIDMSGLPPLFGIPLAIKDNILIEGKSATAASRILENYTAAYDATVIAKLKAEGAIFLGKTNLDEFAMGSSTENSAFGPTKNPRDPMRVPGGSSGGSAAAVAAHMCVAALGSDTGGSIRQPASLCGIVGFKPTYGAVSRYGLIAMASSLDQIGPMTKTVEDTQTLFETITGKDEKDATSADLAERRTQNVERKIGELKIGIPREYFGVGLDPAVEKIIKNAIRKIQSAGARIEEISLPHADYALACYYIIVPSEVSANLARFDGIRYGLRPEGAESLFDAYAETRAQGFGAEAKRRVMLGTYALSTGYYDAYYLKAQRVRRLIREDFERAFERVDLIVGPTTPTPAFAIGAKTQDPLQMYLADIYTVAVNRAGVPGISLPAGAVETDAQPLPVGIQLVGPRFGDRALLAHARLIENILSAS